MQDLKVTLIQCKQFWEDKTANLAHFDSLLESVSDTDLILLPEMFHTGFSMNPEKDLFLDFPEQLVLQQL
jgi:predicted amidohydrolase